MGKRKTTLMVSWANMIPLTVSKSNISEKTTLLQAEFLPAEILPERKEQAMLLIHLVPNSLQIMWVFDDN